MKIISDIREFDAERVAARIGIPTEGAPNRTISGGQRVATGGEIKAVFPLGEDGLELHINVSAVRLLEDGSEGLYLEAFTMFGGSRCPYCGAAEVDDDGACVGCGAR